MTRAELLLKRHKDYLQGEDYLVFFDNRCVGRIFNADAGAPKDQPWFWGLEFHEWQGSEGPHYGNVESREAVMNAFQSGRCLD